MGTATKFMDYYARLRPCTDDHQCGCAAVDKLLLVHIMTASPVRCFACKGYVDPERLELTLQQVDAVASWDRVFGALYRLWLDSAEYEVWAKHQLLQSKGRVNVLGMEARDWLAQSRPTLYWWFHDTDDALPVACPWCAGLLSATERHGSRQCNTCSIVV